jgi:hypothetical protein
LDPDAKERVKKIMEKRNPSSFQQLEKLGEGTYATVCAHPPHHISPYHPY